MTPYNDIYYFFIILDHIFNRLEDKIVLNYINHYYLLIIKLFILYKKSKKY